MPNPFTRRFNVVMDNDEPFEFEWDRDEPPTQTEVRDLWKQSLADQTIQVSKEQMEPMEETPFKFETPNELLQKGLEGVDFYGAQKPQGFPNREEPPPTERGMLGKAWDLANTSILPERKTENPVYGAQTLSRFGDYAYEKLARPALSPLGIGAGVAGAVSIPARIGLAAVGASMGGYAAKEDIPEAWNNPTFENVADVGLDVAGIAGPYLGYKGGAFSKKPGFNVLPDDVELPPNVRDVTQRRLYRDSAGGRGLQLEAQNPIELPSVLDPEVVPPTGPISKVQTPSAGHEWTTLDVTTIPGGEAERMYPTVGGMGLSNAEKINPRTGRPYKTPQQLPRVGGVGEMGIRGDPFFPAIPERVQTSTNQEVFRPVGEMLARPGDRTVTTPTTVYKPGPHVEQVLNPADETFFNERMLAEHAAGLESVPEMILNEEGGLTRNRQGQVTANQGVRVSPKDTKKAILGEVLGPDPDNPLFIENPNYPNKPVEPVTPEVVTVKAGKGIPKVKPEDMPGGEHRFEPTYGVNVKLGKIASNSKIPEVRKAAQAVVDSNKQRDLSAAARVVGGEATASGWTLLDKMGDKGKAVSRFARRVRADANQRAGTVTAKYRGPIDAIKDADFEHVVDVVEGKARLKDQKLAPAVQAVRDMLKEAGQIAERSGMEMYDTKGEPIKFKAMGQDYFPHKFEPGTFNPENLINKLVKEKGMTTAQAKFVVENGIKRGPNSIDPQHVRSLNLSGYRKTKQALFEHVDDLMVKSYESEQFGPRDLGNKGSKLSQMIDSTENPQLARRIMEKQLGRQSHDPNQEAVAHGINSFEAATKLTLFAINQMSQGASVGLRGSLKTFGKALGQTMRNASAEETGAMQSAARATFADTGTSPTMEGFSKALGWNKSEMKLRQFAGNAGKVEAEALHAQLKKNPKDATARAKLDDLLLEDDLDAVIAQPKLSPSQINRGGFRMAELTQGLVEGADLPPMWTDSPIAKVPLMFKRYAFQTSKQLKDLWASNKTPKDKAQMLAKFVALYGAAGELTGDVSTGVRAAASGDNPLEAIKERGAPKKTGKSNLDKELSKFYNKNGIDEQMVNRLLEDIGGSYALGLVGQLAGDATDPRGQRLLSTLAGPAIGDAVGVLGGLAESAQDLSWQPAVRAGVRHLTPLGYSTSKWDVFQDPKKNKKAPMGIRPSMPKVSLK